MQKRILQGRSGELGSETLADWVFGLGLDRYQGFGLYKYLVAEHHDLNSLAGMTLANHQAS